MPHHENQIIFDVKHGVAGQTGRWHGNATL